MSYDELKTAIDWAASEGWNPGLNDAEIFWNTDPEGFIKVELHGEMIGSGSIVSYNGEFGFMGFFIVKPEYRSKGLGTKLWFYRRDLLLERLNENAPIGMDGVFNMQQFYSKGGFKFSHRNLRMEAVSLPFDFEVDENIKAVKNLNRDKLTEYDKYFFGYDRHKFILPWVFSDKHYSVYYKRDNDISGFATLRKCRTGFKIGPLFAEDKKIAEALFKSLLNVAKGDTVVIDIPEINQDAVELVSKYRMKEVFGCARMYYGNPPSLPYDKIFGVTTFELG